MPLPWLKFHTRDWLDSKELRRCSPVARAILADLMCLAHEGEPYGHLSDKIGPMSNEYMAARCFVPLRTFHAAILELKENGRIQQNSDLFIPRMVADEDLRVRRAAGGQLGGNRQLDPAFNSRGFLYLFRRPSDNATKIGVSINPKMRLSDLKKSTREKLEVVHIFKVEDMAVSERALHDKFSDKQVIGEWYALLTEDVAAIMEHCGELNEVNLKFDSEEIKGYPTFKIDSRGRTRADSDSDSSEVLETSKNLKSEKSVSEIWNSAEFDSPEHFASWCCAVYENHPTRGQPGLAESGLRGAVLAGTLRRSEFDRVYALHCASDAWTRDKGRYVPKLSVFVEDRGWMFPPKEIKQPEIERGEY